MKGCLSVGGRVLNFILGLECHRCLEQQSERFKVLLWKDDLVTLYRIYWKERYWSAGDHFKR